jgi:hypothetical protein
MGDGTEFESRLKQFFLLSRPIPGPTQPPIQWVQGAKRPGHKADHWPQEEEDLKLATLMVVMFQSCRIVDSHTGGYEQLCLLWHNAVQSGESQRTFWMKMSPPKRRWTFNGLHGVLSQIRFGRGLFQTLTHFPGHLPPQLKRTRLAG